MTMLQHGMVGSSAGGGVDVGDIGHSLRFRSAASAYLSKTLVTPTTATKWTWSGFVKPSSLAGGYFFSGATVSGIGFDVIGSVFSVDITCNGTRHVRTSTRTFRDPTAHIHFVVAFDSTNATDTDRIKVWANNERVLLPTVVLGSWPALNSVPTLGSAIGHSLGRRQSVPDTYLDGYLSRICFVDGTALDPTSFGYLNTTINEWVSKSQSAVKAVVDAGGTNSFMLDFDDATSLTTLGNDFSSKNNDWTLNNFSLTAGTTYDHMLDVPGNSFATGNPLKPNATYTPALYAGGGLLVTAYSSSGAGGRMGFASTPCPNGQKTVAELTFTSASTAYSYVGICRTTVTADNALTSWMAFQNNGAAGQIYQNFASASQTGLAVWSANDVFRIEVDLVSNSLQFYKNNTAYGTAITITNADDWTICTVHGSGTGNTAVFNYNFGQAPLHASATYRTEAGGYFRDAPTSGFKALCQANLPTPAILNPTTGFVAVTDTEANIDATLATARSGWTDYLDIKKNRAAVESWAWQFSHDSSNEYAIGAASSVWQAKRAMSGANTWVGYSIRIGATYGTAAGSVSHTNGVATTVTHNIGVSARQLILIFRRASTTAVPVYHPDLTSGELLDLCSTAADTASTLITTVATNSFQIGSGNTTGTYDYLVCTEISGFFELGKYTGNGLADGAYHNTGHKPSLTLIKEIGNAQDFVSFDTARATYNTDDYRLFPNTTGAESVTGFPIDEVSMGIKVRNAGNGTNRSGGVYVVADWASVAGKFSLGR